MFRSYIPFLLSSVTLVVLPQCSNDAIPVVKVQPSRFSFFGNPQIVAPLAPSQGVILASKNKPSDRHGMPVYTFSERNRLVRTTAYTCCESDHIQYGSNNAVGTTLKYSSRARSAAADWSFYPLGTVFKINGHSQLYVVDDYGSALVGTGTLDIYHPSIDMMSDWGRRNVEINILKWGSFEQSAAILSKRTGFSHCKQMYANIQRMKASVTETASR